MYNSRVCESKLHVVCFVSDIPGVAQALKDQSEPLLLSVTMLYAALCSPRELSNRPFALPGQMA